MSLRTDSLERTEHEHRVGNPAPACMSWRICVKMEMQQICPQGRMPEMHQMRCLHLWRQGRMPEMHQMRCLHLWRQRRQLEMHQMVPAPLAAAALAGNASDEMPAPLAAGAHAGNASDDVADEAASAEAAACAHCQPLRPSARHCCLCTLYNAFNLHAVPPACP